MRYLINYLNLVYPPISNQEADWLSGDKDVRELVKSSQLYMMGQRQEVYFDDLEFHPYLDGAISFCLKMGEIKSPKISYYFFNEFQPFTNEEDELQIELGKKLIRFSINEMEKVLRWFTPDVLLYLISRNRIKVNIQEEFDLRIFSKFELHYVGISKKDDSFSRLFDQGHKGRLKILSNEYTKVQEARLTDELMIFFFDIESLNMNILDGSEEDFLKDFNYSSEKLKVIADAEKAFVKLLETEYNLEKYNSYPQGKDGLYNDELTRYSYSINEDIAFYTKDIEFVGSSKTMGYDMDIDMIIVEKDEAFIVKTQK